MVQEQGIYLKKILYDNNLSLNDFNKKYEIENINIIKELVKENKRNIFYL